MLKYVFNNYPELFVSFEIRDMYRFSQIGNVSLDFKLIHE